MGTSARPRADSDKMECVLATRWDQGARSVEHDAWQYFGSQYLVSFSHVLALCDWNVDCRVSEIECVGIRRGDCKR
jgi:hypothetical protein